MEIRFPDQVTVDSLNRECVDGQLPETLGFRFDSVEPNGLRGRLTVDSRHLRPGGIMNGGVSLALVETVGSISAACLLDPARENALGLQVSCNHLAIAKPGDTLTAWSRPVHVGRTTHIWEVAIDNQKRKRVSEGRITMLIVARS